MGNDFSEGEIRLKYAVKSKWLGRQPKSARQCLSLTTKTSSAMVNVICIVTH